MRLNSIRSLSILLLATFLSCNAETPQNTVAPPKPTVQHDFSQAFAFGTQMNSMLTSAPPPAPGFTRVIVTLKVSGIAHLVGTGATQRLLVIPNETGKLHTLMLAATPDYISSQTSSLLKLGPRIQKGTSITNAQIPIFR